MSILLLARRDVGLQAVANGLEVMYAFDEGSGQTLADLSGNGHTATLGSTAGADTNDPLWNAAGLAYTTDDFVECGTSAELHSDAWTVCAAMKMTPLQTMPALGWSATSHVPAVFGAAPFNNNRPLIWLAGNCFRYFEKNNPVDVGDGNWHFFVFTCPGNAAADILNAELAVDGQAQAVNTTTNTQAGAAKTSCRLGAAGTVYFAEGETAFLSLHSRVLSGAEQEQMREFAKATLEGRVTLP